MKAWFRAVAAAFGDPAPAQTVAGLMLLILVLYTGYAIPKPSMIGALKWISYINVSVMDPFYVCGRAHGAVANPVRFRGPYIERVSYTQRNMYKSNTTRCWVRGRVSLKPSLWDTWIYLWPEYR